MLQVIRRLVLLAALPVALTGCDLLAYAIYPELMGPEVPDPEFTDPGTTFFGQGTATVEITRDGVTEIYTLNEVSEASAYDTYGAFVTWQNDDGWTVELISMGMGGPNDGSLSTGDMTVNWIHDSESWTAGSFTSTAGHRCAVTVWEMSARNVSGKTNCVGIQWADASDPFTETPEFVESEEPFDLTVTFEALPLEEPPVTS